MGRVLITGAGHSGTNLVLETLRLSNSYKFFPDDGVHTEDRHIHIKLDKIGLPINYGTKLCTENTMIEPKFLTKLLRYDPKIDIIFCMRNPVDTALARIFKFNGELGYDAKGNIEHLNHTADVLDFFWKESYGLYPIYLHKINIYYYL